jgi:phosphoglycolate phosphatase
LVAPRLLVLDLDGTLVDSAPDLMAALNRRLAEQDAIPLPLTAVAAMMGDGARVLLRRGFAARGLAAGSNDIDAFMADYLATIAVATRFYPGIIETLHRLAGEGWRFAVCTNKPDAATRALLAALDAAELFAAVGAGDSFATKKPDPAHLLATIAAAGGDPARAVMIGDHSNDVLAATGAGVPCIFAAWGYGSPEMAIGSAAVAQSFAEAARIASDLLP